VNKEKNIVAVMFITVCILTFIACVINAEAKPLLIYGKGVNVTRAKILISHINESYFNNVETIAFRDSSHLTQDWGCMYQFRGKKFYFTCYNFEYRNDEYILNALFHEIGHKEYILELMKKYNIGQIVSLIGYDYNIFEVEAERWRMEKGGDASMNLSSVKV
jgi:hypothetical protein